MLTAVSRACVLCSNVENAFQALKKITPKVQPGNERKTEAPAGMRAASWQPGYPLLCLQLPGPSAAVYSWRSRCPPLPAAAADQWQV